MKLPPRAWAVLGGIAAVAVIGGLAASCGEPKGLRIAPAKGTDIRLKSYTDTTIEVEGLASQEANIKMTLAQRVRFASDPAATQAVELTTESCFIDGGEQNLLSLAGVEEALRQFEVEMSIRPTGETVSLKPKTISGLGSAARNIIQAQLWSLQSGLFGYILPANGRLAKGRTWEVPVNLADAVSDSTNKLVMPVAATATYTFTYLGEIKRDGVNVHHIKRSGKGSLRQKLNVQGMDSQETETTMTSEADLYIDVRTGLLVHSESTDNSVIDFGAIKMKQTSKTTVDGSRPN